MFLQSEHLYLRALEPTDLDFLYTLENDVDIWPVSNTSSPYSKYVLQQYLEQATADIYSIKQLRLLICSAQHQPVGAIDLFDFDPAHDRAGIGITIAPPFRQLHFATQALQLLLHYCHEKLLLHQVYCSVLVTNTNSIKLFQQAGFKEIGTRQQWVKTTKGWQDVLDFQKIFIASPSISPNI
jgi:diamine N-acetyltransferase